MRTAGDSHDREIGVAFLSAYAGKMEALMALLRQGQVKAKIDKARVSEMYRALKSTLKEDYRRLSRRESQGEATHIEAAFLLPAVHQASTRLRPATNTNPSTSDWFGAVYSARIDVLHFLIELKK